MTTSDSQSLAEILDRANGLWLNREEVEGIEAILRSNASDIKDFSIEDQQSFLGLCMSNFSLFVVVTRNLDLCPGPLKYAVISKAMYQQGLCGCPTTLSDDVEKLLEAEPRSFWLLQETEESSFELREQVVSNPIIGAEPLLDEWENCGDLGVLAAVLRNPECPAQISRAIAAGDHFVFSEDSDFGEESLGELVALAAANLRT